MSVVSFILLISGLKKSRKMVKYNEHEGLNLRMQAEGMPGYEVKLGMGLHLGYSIEGALGSFYKIDPTYLSPHVKMSERLESSTKVFKVPLLISEPLWTHMSKRSKSYTRPVDWVRFSGSKDPMKLYTVDVKPEKIALEERFDYMSSKERKFKRIQDRMIRNNLRQQALNGTQQISTMFQSNPEIKAMISPYTDEFRRTYKEGYELSIKGEWGKAKSKFEESILLVTEADDPLSKNHLNFMKQNDFIPPSGWQGWKEFDE